MRVTIHSHIHTPTHPYPNLFCVFATFKLLDFSWKWLLHLPKVSKWSCLSVQLLYKVEEYNRWGKSLHFLISLTHEPQKIDFFFNFEQIMVFYIMEWEKWVNSWNKKVVTTFLYLSCINQIDSLRGVLNG